MTNPTLPTEISAPTSLPSRPRKKTAKRWLGIAALGILGIGGYLLSTGWAPILKGVAVAKTHPNLLFDKVHDKHFNILLIGEDRNWKIQQVLNPRTGKFAPMNAPDKTAPPRSDTMIVLSLDENSRKMRLLSLPRDARVRFHDPSGDRHKAKLNAVYAAGGKDPKARRAILTNFLANELGIRIDRTAVVNIDGFTGIIDKLGGIQVDVDGALERDSKTGKLYRGHIHRVDHWGQWSVDLDPGLQMLSGKQAQGYVRFRYDIEGDPGRIRRQQQVMRALAKSIAGQSIFRIPGTAAEMRKKFATDMNDTELVSAAFFTKGMNSSVKIQPMTPYGIYASNGDIILNKPENIKLFSAIFGSSFSPNKFLVKSPSTEHDSIGHTNNGNPSAADILREAGLLTAKDAGKKSNPILDAPVRR